MPDELNKIAFQSNTNPVRPPVDLVEMPSPNQYQTNSAPTHQPS